MAEKPEGKALQFTGREGLEAWLKTQPPEVADWAIEDWVRLIDALLPMDDWRVFLDWHRRRHDGVPTPETSNSPPSRKKNRKANPSPAWDFFLSYNSADEAHARFVDDVLRKADFRVFAQFRDMPAGCDFLEEMRNGLHGSARLIAILLPRYLASKFCRAEWNAAHADDPIGEKRKLIAFLVEPAELDLLAKRIVHKSLIGLSREDAAKAILEAVGFI